MVRTVHTAVHLQAPLVLKNNSVVDIPRSLHSPDQMVDQHLETTSTALNVSGDQDT